MKRVSRGVGLVIGVTMFAVGAIGEGIDVPSDALPLAGHPLVELADRLQSEDGEARLTAYRQILSDHDRLVERLIEIAQDEEKPPFPGADSRYLAVRLLGEIRAFKSIPMLIENVEFRPASPIAGDEPSILAAYPCGMALRNMGPVASGRILRHLRESPPDEVTDRAIEIYAAVLWGTYGRAPDGRSGAFEAVERAIANATATRRENLERLLKILEKDWALPELPAPQ